MSPELERACIEVYRRYAIEIVEALDFCPYAARAREQGRTREVVMPLRELDLDAALSAVDALAADTMVEVAFLIWPLAHPSRLEFSRFVESVRARHQRECGGRLVLAMEGFHPCAEANLESPAHLIPFVRRTPDPTIQLVRLSVLEHVRRGAPGGTQCVDPDTVDLAALLSGKVEAKPLHERIAETNHRVVLECGEPAIRERLDEILMDRNQRYERLGERRRSRGEQ